MVRHDQIERGSRDAALFNKERLGIPLPESITRYLERERYGKGWVVVWRK